jgi:hypothetical protein
MFGPTCRRTLFFAFATGCWMTTVARSAPPAPTSHRRPAQELVAQLGDASYKQREHASQELLEIGLAAKAALADGMRHPDFEIALRCRRLWDDVRVLAGWQRVRPMLGDSPGARALYDKMFLADIAFWYELAEQPGTLDGLFPERRAQLQQVLQQAPVSLAMVEGALANAFYFGVLAKRSKPQQELESVDDLLRLGLCRQALRDNEALSDLWDLWAKATGSDGPALDRLLRALQNKQPQARGIALNLLADERIPAGHRQYALLTLAKFKNPADEEWIRKWLDDQSPLDTLFSRGVVIKSQLRDVALAATIYRAGEDPEKFGFHYLKADPNTLYSPSSLGFTNDEERTQAMKNWTAFTAKRAARTTIGASHLSPR